MADHGYFEELIMAAVDGELTPDEDAALRAHLETCPDCRAFYETMEAVSGVTAKHLPSPPPELASRVMETVRAIAPQKKKRIIPFPTRALAVAAAAAVVLWAGFSFFPLRMGSSSGPRSSDTAVNNAPAAVMSMDQAAPQEPMMRIADVPAGGAERGVAEESVMEQETAAVTEGMDTAGTMAGGAASEVASAWLLYTGEDTSAAPLLESGDNDLWATLLAVERSAEVPDREADYTLVCLATDSGPQSYRLWDVDGVIVVETPAGLAGYTVSVEAFSALLENAGK